MAQPKVKYVPDHRDFARMALGPDMYRAMRRIAENGAVYAKAISPRSGRPDRVPYAESFSVSATTRRVGWRNEPRASAKLVNDAPHAAAVEWHNGSHTLRRTASFIDGNPRQAKKTRGRPAKARAPKPSGAPRR